MSRAAELLTRYLQQRRGLGGEEIVFDPSIVDLIRNSAAVAGDPGPSTEAWGRGAVVREKTPRSAGAGVASTPASLSSEETQSLPLVQITGNPSLDELRGTAMGCVACGLAHSRTTVVFGEGDPSARLVVVGEAPGADEDRSGRPFVGRAGKLLDQLLASIGFPRQSVYICNVLKCRPPGNRNPLPVEVEACSPFLRRQLEIVAPEAILAVGTFPAQTLLGTTEPIGRIRGTLQEYQGIPLIPTYHPAALLRNPGWIRPVWEDLQHLRAVLDGRAAASPSS